MTLCPGRIIDQELIRERINEIAKYHDVQRIVYDPWNAAWLSRKLEDDGFEVLEFPQRINYFAEPTKLFEESMIGGKLAHSGNPLLRWQVDLVQPISNDNGDIRPSKKRSRDRIDGVVAAIMAFSQALGEEAELSSAAFA